MKTRIGKFDPATGTVPVLFEHDDVKHRRPVNAVLIDGVYDPEATKERVAEVALGVEHKIAIGAICNALPEAGHETSGDADNAASNPAA